jgi:hypothetical protein
MFCNYEYGFLMILNINSYFYFILFKLDDANSTKHERRPPEDGQTIVTETCRVLIMCFTNIFINLEF